MIPFQISFRDFPPSEAVGVEVQTRLEDLEKYFDHIISANVVMSMPHRHQHKGRIPHVQVRLQVPGTSLVVSRETEKNWKHEDIYVAIADAFEAMERQLKDYVHQKRNFIKEHSLKSVPGWA